MKIYTGRSKPIRVAIAVVALWLVNPRQLGAIPSPEQHEMSGTVQRVDRETITIVIAGESKPVVFAWNKDTKFVRNGALIRADALKGSAHVQIRCSHPIFGSPLLYRVAWQTQAPGNKSK